MNNRRLRFVATALSVGGACGALGLLTAPQAAAADPTADLAVIKTTPVPTADGRFSYLIVISNNGPDPSSGWTATDPMEGVAQVNAPPDIRSSDPRCAVVPTGTHGGLTQYALRCQGGSLAVGASTTIEVSSADGTRNQVFISGNEADSNVANNQAASTTPIDSIPMINSAIAASAAATALAAGGAINLIRRRQHS
ncbi:hypothetical protein AB0N62_43295 [Streptomyces sp. NPDC093982]|uniref:hypothetical protein n=1 Tax=Streptomyces sp. NPDC093982 TaxID=3155077 RepID=UPI00342FB1AE